VFVDEEGVVAKARMDQAHIAFPLEYNLRRDPFTQDFIE
jgi:hypothetical protein